MDEETRRKTIVGRANKLELKEVKVKNGRS
jgi:hypothetical protein